MSFEKKFPSLKNKETIGKVCERSKQDNVEFKNEKDCTCKDVYDLKSMNIYHPEDIQECCLDKQKVKEVIDELTYHVMEGKLNLVYVDDLKKELGLE